MPDRTSPIPVRRNPLSPLALLALMAVVGLSFDPRPARGDRPTMATTATPAAGGSASSSAAVSPAALPAAGRHVAFLTVPRFGRYAVSLESKQGASLEIVDRVAGSLGTNGTPGSADGRLDLFLDRGGYQVIVVGDERAKGSVALRVEPSRELADSPGPVLTELKPVAASLEDHQQISWWLRIAKRRAVFLEAAGRDLSDLRLWRDGTWLEDAAPRCALRQPVVGQPLLDCQLAVTLEPGLVRLTAYGGKAQPWAQAADAGEAAVEAHPLFLRWGVPNLPGAGRRRFVVSPFGSDRFLAPAPTNFFRIELPGAATASLRAGNALPNDPYFRRAKVDADITKQSRPPAVEVTVPEATAEDRNQTSEEPAADATEQEVSGDDASDANEASAADDASGESVQAEDSEGQGDEAQAEESDEASAEPPQPRHNAAGDETTEGGGSSTPPQRWIEVSGAPGQPYVLQHFELRDVYTFERSGRYWLSTVQTGAVGDEADATALLITPRSVQGGRRFEVAGSAILPLGAGTAFVRRFNLLDDVSLFFRVAAAGSYQIVSRGAVARFRFEPYFATPPRDYKAPALRASGEPWALDPGIYVLSVHPESKGVLDLAIRLVGDPQADVARALDWLASTPPAPRTAPRGEARFGALDLHAGESYSLISGQRPGVRSGVVLRGLPIDLAAALPLALQPGETVTVEGEAPVAGALRAEAEDGTPLPIAVDGNPPQNEPEVAAGRHSVAVANAGPRTVAASLVLVAADLRPQTADAPLPQADLDALPRFTTLTPGAALHLDLASGEHATYLVHADQPALYEVASTGLLTVTGNMRTRTIPSLASGDANGVGQNFALRPYLGAGDYQLTVATRGASSGHLGVALRQTELRDGGVLRDNVPGRATLGAGEGIAFRFTVSEAGEYRLRGAGEGYTYRCRLEDADGWPVTKPDIDADLRLHLLPGSYRLVLLPRATPAKAVALFEKIERAAVGKGHGPDALPLGHPVAHLWSEPAAGGERQSDVYTFHLAAKAQVRVAIDNEMQGRLQRQGDAGNGLAQAAVFVPPGRGWTGELAAGDYSLAVECSRRNNLVTYTVSATPEELVAGSERSVQAPGEVAVAIGDAGMTEIESQASSSVRATLLDDDGNVVARAAARPDDWNFLLSGRIAPGRYRLRVEPVAVRALRVGLVMRSRVEVGEQAVTLPLDRQLDPGEAVHLLPLQIPPGAELLAVTLASRENVGGALERLEGEVWRPLAAAVGRSPRLAVALDGEHPLPLRLRVWSIDGRGETLRVQSVAAQPRHARESDLRAGIALAALKGFTPALGGAIVDLDRPGVLRHRALAAGLLQAGAVGQALAPSEDGQIVALGRRVFLLGDVGARAQAERVALGRGAGKGSPVPGSLVVKVRLPEGGHVAVDVAAANGPLVAMVRSLSLQPGVRAGATDTASGEALAVAAGAAVSVALRPSSPAVLVWNAGGDAAGDAELGISMPQVLAAESAGFGVREGALSGDTALPLALPAGRKRVVLTLGETTVAAFADGDQVRSVHWQGGEAFEQTLTSEATKLVLLHGGAGPTPYRLELLPETQTGAGSAESLAALRAGAPFERAFDRSGSLRLRVEAPVGAGEWSLHVRGAEGSPIFVADDGRVLRGADLQPRAPGALIVRHGPGVAVAWVNAGARRASPWPQDGLVPVAQSAPGVLPLRGTNLRLRVPLGPALALQLRTAAPVATVVARAAGAEVEIHPAGARLHALAEGDGVDVLLHGLAGGELSGVVELTTTPVQPLEEGLNAPLLLAGGDRAYFGFELEERRRIGVGVRADGSAVECELLTAAGRSLGRGVLQLVDLDPGRYLLALGLPPDAAPAAARPVIVGLDAPSTGPPPDVIRSYLQALTQATPGTGGEQ